MKGTRKIMAARIILYTISALLSILPGFILVRKLNITDYAAYQSLNKRVRAYILAGFTFINLWVFRDSARLLPGTYDIALLFGGVVGVIGGLVGATIVYGISHCVLCSIIAFAGMLAFSYWSIFFMMLDSLRPVRVGVVRAATRLAYSGLVILLVYLLAEGLQGAVTSLFLGYLIGLVLAVKWLPSNMSRIGFRKAVNVLRSVWSKRLRASIYRIARPLIRNIDVLLIIPLAGTLAVSAFFAMRAISNIILDSFLTSMTFLQAAGLRGTGREESYTALRLGLAGVSPLLVYPILYNMHVVYLLNPRYAWAAMALVILNLATLTELAAAGLLNIFMGQLRGLSFDDEAREIERMSFRLITPAIVYIIGLSIVLLLWRGSVEKTVIGWSLLLWLFFIVDSIIISTLKSEYIEWSPREHVREVYLPYTKYLIVAFIASMLFPPPKPPLERFIPEALNIIMGGLPALVVYVILLLLIDGEVRSLARRLVGILRSRIS